MFACTHAAPPKAPKEPPREPLATSPLTSLVSGAGLVWMTDLSLASIRATPWFAREFDAATRATPLRDLEADAEVPLSSLDEALFARVSDADLALARGRFNGESMVARFTKKLEFVDAPSHGTEPLTFAPSGLAFEPTLHVSGRAGDALVGMTVFGADAFGTAHTVHPPLRVLSIAERYAEGKLKRVLPALASPPLSDTERLIGAESPIRLFIPGPFEGETRDRLSGLLRAATAVAISVAPGREEPRVRLRVVVLGEWGEKPEAAATLFAAAFDTWSHDILGRATGIDHPLSGPQVTVEGGALRLETEFDGARIAAAMHSFTDATTAELFRNR